MKRIVVVGLGQIGGSIVLTLRKKKAPYHITGIEVSKKRLQLMKLHLDAISKQWNDADLTVLCLHFDQAAEFLKKASTKTLITDVCSGKSKLLEIANKRKLRFVGGHPMAGNEFEGEKGWREDLFANAPYFLTPGKHASKQDVQTIRQLANDLGAKPKLIDAKLHDQFLAITSHFPAFLSQMIEASAERVPEEFQGPGFRSMTRLAKTSPALLNTFLQSNSANVIPAAKQFRKQLDKLINTKAQGITQRHKDTKKKNF
jgi:prephenate dehydrogenase